MYELGSRTRIAPHQLFSPQHQVHHRLLHRSTAFLDILISLKDGFLKTDIHTKPTDSHAYLPNSSCHPRHVVKNIPYSQFLRLRRLCADTEVFNARCDEMEGRFLRRGHHLKNVQEAGARASNTPRSETLQHKPDQSTNRTPFIVTHHPSNPPSAAGSRNSKPPSYTPAGECSRRSPTLPSLRSATASRCDHYSCRPPALPTGHRPWLLQVRQTTVFHLHQSLGGNTNLQQLHHQGIIPNPPQTYLPKF